jgi:hypothetical protein
MQVLPVSGMFTSFGTSLTHEKDAENYRLLILGYNAAGGRGRYEVWNEIDHG